MRIVITGANGFLGRKVVDRLLAADGLGEGFPAISSLVLLDLHMGRSFDDPRVRAITGSFTDKAQRDMALEGGVDLLFHLASLPGGAAQSNFHLGRAVNLEGPMALMDAVCDRHGKGRPPIVVNASSIAAIGPVDDVVTDDTPLRPLGSYGCHKLMMEIYLSDLTARGWLDARSVRPAGIVPRPREAFEGFATAWMSELFHVMLAGLPLEIPMAPEGRTWLQSVDCVADNCLLAARLPAAGLPRHRAWTLPALSPSMQELIQAIGRHTSPAHAARISHGEAALNPYSRSMPDQRLPHTEALGFHHDASLDAFVQAALAEIRPRTA
jgi:nucleoside-diphosphate-sugar epimerase